MNIIIIEEVERGYKPYNLSTKISEDVTLTTKTHVFYERSHTLAVCENARTSREVIKRRKEYLTKKFGADILKEPLNRTDTYIFFKTFMSTVTMEADL